MKAHVATFDKPEIAELVTKIGVGTLKLYRSITEQLPRTPLKFHYIFNLRDLSRVYEGLLRSTVDKFNTREGFLRLWRNECERVFVDRLVIQEDKDLVQLKVFPLIL